MNRQPAVGRAMEKSFKEPVTAFISMRRALLDKRFDCVGEIRKSAAIKSTGRTCFDDGSIYRRLVLMNKGFKKDRRVFLPLLLCVLCAALAACSAGNSTLSPDAADSAAGSVDVAESKTISENEEAEIASEDVADYTEPATSQNEYIIEDFPVLLQLPELPTGCEITALTMMLHAYGFDVDKVTMATSYLPTEFLNLYYGDDGTLYGNDLNKYFIGDPTTAGGYVCGTGAIITAANGYFSDCGSSMQAVDMTGASPEELYQLVKEDTPVLVWVTIDMQDRYAPTGMWYTESGVYVDWSTNDHGAVLIGYTEDTVTIADPLSGLMVYDKEQFEEVFASRSNQCVILQ